MVFAAPTIFVYTTVVIIPFIYGIYLTFTDWNGISSSYNFIGLDNYKSVIADKVFWDSFLLTFKFTIITVVLVNVIAFSLALLVTRGFRGSNLLRAIYFTPNLIGGVILGFIWQFIFMKVFRYLGAITDIKIFDIAWLTDEVSAFWGLVIVAVWQMSGYMMVIYIAGLQNVPHYVIEASLIDGANSFQRFRFVTLPLMMQSVTISIFLTLSNSFKIFDLNLALTNGGPYGSTEMVTLHIYNEAFLFGNFGAGQAKAIIFTIVIASITFIQVYLSKKKEVEM